MELYERIDKRIVFENVKRFLLSYEHFKNVKGFQSSSDIVEEVLTLETIEDY